MRLSRFIPGLLVIALSLVAQNYPPQDDQGAPAPTVQQTPVDEPGRAVARISVLSGDASVKHTDGNDWVAAVLNAPLMAGDTLSTAPGTTAELEMDFGNFARIAGDSEIRISSLDGGKYQIQLSKGLLTYRALRQTNAQSEIATPLIAVRPVGLAAVRVEVAPDGSTRATVRHGDVEVFTPQGTEQLHEGNTMMVRGQQDDPEFQVASAAAPDQWDTWNDQRDDYLSRAQSPRYVSQDVVGTEDLDANGRWSYDPSYGDVWSPNVPATWAPYRNGQWVWQDYYGWTWVDAEPWGWAPFHYGSWYFRTGFGWSWWPGARYGHYWYRPALVGFFGFGGGGFGVGFGYGNVGWIPLAPFEVYRPWYGRGWYGGGRPVIVNNVNIVRNVNIANEFRNARFANAVTAVSANDFQRGNFHNPIGVNRNQLAQASLVRGGVPVSPTANNMRFSSRPVTAAGPRQDINNQRFFSRMPSSAGVARNSFAGQQPGTRAPSEFRPNGGGNPSWQRFGGSQPGNAYGAGQPRTVPVAPPMVRQRGPAPAYNNGGYNQGFRSAPPQSAPRPAYGGQAPVYRPSPAPAPSFRSAPAPSFRSAPPPAPRGGGGGGGGRPNGGGGAHSSGGGGHSGGHR